MFREYVRMSWQNIVGNKLRSFLTILGIVIGVASIVALITIVQGVTREVTGRFKSMGTNKLTVQAYGTPLKMGLNDSDLRTLSELDGIQGISPTVSTIMPVVAKGKVVEAVSIQGKNEMYFRNEFDTVLRGRALNSIDVECGNRVCLINEDLENELFFGIAAVGEKLVIGGISYDIVGVFNRKSSFSPLSVYESHSVIVPYVNAMRLAGVNNITSIDVYMSDSESSDRIVESIESVLDQAFNYRSGTYSIINMDDLLDMMNDVVGMMTVMLGGIASIALLVGGIGIMNMMLVSVAERTAEIGLRKALGAEPKDIQIQFLIESVFLSTFGGIIGLGTGEFIALLVSKIAGFGFYMSLRAALTAIGFSIAVGVVFGFAPASRASRLNPIEALRSM